MAAKKPKLVVHETEQIEVARLRPHPRNYRKHPEDQLVHLAQSLREHGFYRNVVIAEDDVLLAGHGVVEAARMIGLETIPVVRLPVASDSPQALKLVAADNELGRFAIVDDRALAPTFSFATPAPAHERAQALVGPGGYAEVLVYATYPATERDLRRTVYRFDRPPVVEVFDADRGFIEISRSADLAARALAAGVKLELD